LSARVTAGSLTDTDGVCYDGDGDGTCEFDSSDDYTALTDSGGTELDLDELRFGRLFIGTAFGSELLPLSVPFQTEYFNSTTFIVNLDDDMCTGFAGTDLLLTSGVAVQAAGPTIDINNDAVCLGGGNATAAITNPMSNGKSDLSFSVAAAAASCTGYIDIDVNLTAQGYPYLLYDWDGVDQGGDGNIFDDNPYGRAEFGLFEGPNQIIYIREPGNF